MTDRLMALMEAPQRFKTEVIAADESTTLGEGGQVMYPSRDFH